MLSGKGNRGIVHCRGRGVGLDRLQESLISFGNLIEFFGEWGDSRPMTFTRQIFRDLHEYLNSGIFHKPSIFCLRKTTFFSRPSLAPSDDLILGAIFHRQKILSDFKK